MYGNENSGAVSECSNESSIINDINVALREDLLEYFHPSRNHLFPHYKPDQRLLQEHVMVLELGELLL
jgi:hypothetical protein